MISPDENQRFETVKKWYLVDHHDLDYMHVFEDEDEAHAMVLEEVFSYHGRTMEPDTTGYVEEITDTEIVDLQNDRRAREIKIHTKGNAA